MRIAIGLAGRDGLSMAETARVLAHLAMAQADAFIACWDAKYTYWSGRPIGLIAGFASTIITPNFPAYISGHATLSGASSTVLAAFFPADAAGSTPRPRRPRCLACTAASTGEATTKSGSRWGAGSASWQWPRGES